MLAHATPHRPVSSGSNNYWKMNFALPRCHHCHSPVLSIKKNKTPLRSVVPQPQDSTMDSSSWLTLVVRQLAYERSHCDREASPNRSSLRRCFFVFGRRLFRGWLGCFEVVSHRQGDAAFVVGVMTGGDGNTVGGGAKPVVEPFRCYLRQRDVGGGRGQILHFKFHERGGLDRASVGLEPISTEM
jgi:hypothetical protein